MYVLAAEPKEQQMMRSRTSRRTTLLAACALGLGAAVAPLAASAAPAGQVDLCHYDADMSVYKLIKVAPAAVPFHLRNHPDGLPGETVPGERGYTFGDGCNLVSHLVTVNFDDVDTSSGEVQLTSYAGFSWTKGWVYRPGNPDALGYGVSSPPNIGFIGYPLDLEPLVLQTTAGDVSFTSVFVTNPSNAGSDPVGPITVTIEGSDDGATVGTQQVTLADGTSQTVALTFDSVDTLTMSADGKYFGIDDLTYFPSS